MKRICLLGLMAVATLLGMPPGRSQSPIVLYYNERPPYLVTEADGAVSGLTATPAAAAFAAAGIPFVWVKLPSNRQLLNIRKGADMECAVGWFKTAERQRFAKFTKSVYRDLPTVALGNPRFGFRSGMRLEQVLAMPDVRVLLKENYSYGSSIDRLLAEYKPHAPRTANENLAMLRMIELGRADFMLVAEEEAKYLMETAGADSSSLRVMRFSDMPPGEKRYVMCSRGVADAMIERVNRHIPGD